MSAAQHRDGSAAERRPARSGIVAAALAATLAMALLGGCAGLPGWMVAQGRSTVDDHRHFDNAPIAASTRPRPLPDAPAPLRWPGGLDDAAARALIDGSQTQALLVLRRGQLVHEQYAAGFTRQSVGTSFSVAKSVVSAMVGIALAEGRIASLDEPVTRHLPELRTADARFDAITLRHLLAMRSGIRFSEDYGSPFSDAGRLYLQPSIAGELARLRVESAPDVALRYQSINTQLLGMVVERAMGAPLARLVETRLWQPMGAEFDASWSLDSAARGTDQGVAKGFCCLNARAVDFARFGQLFLDGGMAEGRRVLSADWVRDSTAAQAGLPGGDDAARRNVEQWGRPRMAFYAWQWRRTPEGAWQQPGWTPVADPARAQPGSAFYAQGLHGQYIVVVPDTQTVVVRLGRAHGNVNWPRWLEALARLNP